MGISQNSDRKLDWKLLLLQGLGSGLGGFLGSLATQSAWGAALGAALGAFITFPVSRLLKKSS